MPNDDGDAGKVLSVWLTHEELAEVERVRERSGLKRNTIVRQMIRDWIDDFDSGNHAAQAG